MLTAEMSHRHIYHLRHNCFLDEGVRCLMAHICDRGLQSRTVCVCGQHKEVSLNKGRYLHS